MKILGMDDILIEIYNIKNITSISLWDRINMTYKDSKSELIPGLFVMYDGSKMINMCASDKYFDIFVRKVMEVYQEEKDKDREDDLTDPFGFRRKIDIDKHTLEVLESGKLDNINEIYSYYQDMDGYEDSLFFKKDSFMLLYPMIKYHIEDFFSKTDMKVLLDNNISGYRDRYMISSKVNNIDKDISVSFKEISDHKYEFMIYGLYKNTNSIKLEIEFKNGEIFVSIYDKDNDVYATYSYKYTDGKMKNTISIMKGYLNVYYEDKCLDMIDNKDKNITDFDSNNNLSFYRLPWNSMYGIDIQDKAISENESVLKYHTMYVDILDDSFMKRERYLSSYVRKDTAYLNGIEVVLDEVNKNTLGRCLSATQGIYVIETAFLEGRDVNGYYDERLKNRYFYHVVRSMNGIKDINSSKLVKIRKNDILKNSDLVNKGKILGLIKGE